MIQPAERRGGQKRAPKGTAGVSEDLPYTVEMWNDAQSGVLRVIARAHNVLLARAIFRAACEENPERGFTLRKGGRTLASSLK